MPLGGYRGVCIVKYTLLADCSIQICTTDNEQQYSDLLATNNCFNDTNSKTHSLFYF